MDRQPASNATRTNAAPRWLRNELGRWVKGVQHDGAGDRQSQGILPRGQGRPAISVVQLRTLLQSAFLRWFTQRHRLSSCRFRRRQGRGRHFLRLQAHRGSTFLRWNAQQSCPADIAMTIPTALKIAASQSSRSQDSPRASLDGSCYVFSPHRAALTERGTIAYCTVIGPQSGALFQSQFYLRAKSGKSPVIASGDRHTVLFVTEGDGEVEISGQPLCGPLADRRLYRARRGIPTPCRQWRHAIVRLEWAGRRRPSFPGRDAGKFQQPNIPIASPRSIPHSARPWRNAFINC